ncbi:MAG: DNA polymerase III subunit alpha, partial [Treponema sp.]|nr:DNA polymerase III subunit alpha [Treponema sp.]
MKTRLGLCSAYSLLYGVRKPAQLLDRAAADGAKTVSICDFNNLYGVHTFIEAAKERQMRPVIGAALTAGESTGPAVYCFAENRDGFARICEILTLRKKDVKKFNPVPLLRENSGGLVLASCDSKILYELAGKVKKIYAAITPDDISAMGIHGKLPVPPAFLDTAVFLDKSDCEVHRVLRAIGLNKTVGNLTPSETLGTGDGFFKNSAELHDRLKSWPLALKGTEEIAEACRFDEIFNGFIFPGYGENPGAELRRRVYNGAELRYGELGDMETERIEYELGIIEEKGFSPYFLRMDDIVKMAENPMSALIPGLNRTCGRGSGAASIVSYSLGITNVDPITYSLYFERFLNPSRPDPPDIDVDFAWDERDELIKLVIKQFGPDYCARVANHNFFRPRSALRETAKAYGFSDAQISALERKVFDLGEKPDTAGGVNNAGHDTPDLWEEIYRIAARVEGLPRGLGMHCGGLVITAQPINRLAPIEKSLEGYPLLAWEKEGAEAAGFVKIDLLGNRSLAVIRDAFINLGEQNVFINPYSWRPAEDEATVQALARGDSIGVFYIESPAMRQLQKKTGRGDFEHIVIHSSLIRPAANRFINEYVRRLKGGKWKHLHPRLEKILDETYGILCYQEDVSKTASALAGFSEADADKLRKVIAKKAGSAKLAVYEKQFFEGCRNNLVDEETIKKIWEMMLSFDGYSFCKPHSASYAMVSFQSAYLRVHYPAQFMAAVISNQGGFYRPGAYISECRRMGLILEGPDVNLSRWKYYGEGRRVVIGFMSIKGLSITGARRLISERENHGEYKSLQDFMRRVKPSRDDIVALCPAGVFDSISGRLADSAGGASYAGGASTGNILPRQMQARLLLMNPAAE